MTPWDNVFSNAVQAGFGNSSSASGSNDKKGDFSVGRMKQCGEVPRTHVHLPAGGLFSELERKKEEGQVRYASWDFRGRNETEAKKICQLANEVTETRKAMGYDKK